MIGRLGRPRDGTEMSDRLARVGLVNHRRQDHQAVDADLLRIRREPASERGRVLGDAAQHRHSPGRHARPSHASTSSFSSYIERAVLADRAQHDQPVDARVDHLVDMGHRRRDIKRLVRLKLSRGRRKHPLPRNVHRTTSQRSRPKVDFVHNIKDNSSELLVSMDGTFRFRPEGNHHACDDQPVHRARPDWANRD